MTLAVENPILNNPFEEPKKYWIYDEGQPKRMLGRRPAGYYFRSGRRSDAQAALFTEEKFVELEIVNKIRHGLSSAQCRPQGIGATFFKELNCYVSIKNL